MSELLNDEQVTTALADLDGWTRDGAEIVRTTERESFPTAIEDVRRVAEAAEARDHHPDIDIRWRTLTFRLSTHSAGGLTAKDIDLATEINRLLAN